MDLVQLTTPGHMPVSAAILVNKPAGEIKLQSSLLKNEQRENWDEIPCTSKGMLNPPDSVSKKRYSILKKKSGTGVDPSCYLNSVEVIARLLSQRTDGHRLSRYTLLVD